MLQYDTFPNTLGPNLGVIYSDNVVGASATSRAFRAPRMTLQMGAPPVDIGLHVRGPTAPYPPALVPQYSVRMKLDPRVLLLARRNREPVRITVFADGSAISAGSPISPQRMFDPGATEFVSVNTPANYQSREIFQPTLIQFRLEATRYVVNASLAAVVHSAPVSQPKSPVSQRRRSSHSLRRLSRSPSGLSRMKKAPHIRMGASLAA